MTKLTVKQVKEVSEKIADNVEKIGELIEECKRLSDEINVSFSLEEFDFFTREELYDSGWSDSNC